MALDYDFYLSAGATSLGFNKHVSPEIPEERATAQFRKEQFDSQATVGDQSLTGWWTRGQLSFHRGAGVRYYEVLEGESVFSRYLDSEHASVFTPGEVTLTKELYQFPLDVEKAVSAPLSMGGGGFLLTGTGVIYTVANGNYSIATSDANIPTSIASNGSLYYLTNGSKIERQYAASEARVNHVTNPSFEAGLADWTAGGGGGTAFLTQSTARAKYGSVSAVLSASGGAGSSRTLTTTVSGLSIGTTYVAKAWVYIDSPSASHTVDMTMAGVTDTLTATNPESWQLATVNFTATGTSHDLVFTVHNSTVTPNAWFDSILVTESPFAGDYFDGSQPGCAWSGTAHASKSSYSTASDGASVVRVTSTDNTFEKVWWAKGRIWAVDGSNQFYALADAVASVSATDKFWASTNPAPLWSLTDSPGPVYISDGADIFAVSVDDTGLVPTLTSPVTVGRLPLGEQVVDLAYHLSNLVITTTRGVRIAVIQNDRIFMGPLTVTGDFSRSNGTGAYGSLAYVAGRLDERGGDVVCCAIDLASANDDLTFAWQPVAQLSNVASSFNGVTVDPVGRIFAWASGSIFISSLDEQAFTGYITTGYHRFGTLDDKHFDSVTVRTSGYGTIGVYRVDASGAETLLSTVDASVGEAEIPLGLTAPAERVALKFVLNRLPSDITRGPTLLGYQLRALPVPRRQRMKRVPLMLFDREKNRSGHEMGNDGSAWTRLLALEALEESNAVVDFEDKETGETGSAYIESVEMRRSAPSSRLGDGFGGTIWVTLRVI